MGVATADLHWDFNADTAEIEEEGKRILGSVAEGVYKGASFLDTTVVTDHKALVAVKDTSFRCCDLATKGLFVCSESVVHDSRIEGGTVVSRSYITQSGIGSGCVLESASVDQSVVRNGAKILHSRVRNADLGEGVVVEPFCHLEGVTVPKGMRVRRHTEISFQTRRSREGFRLLASYGFTLVRPDGKNIRVNGSAWSTDDGGVVISTSVFYPLVVLFHIPDHPLDEIAEIIEGAAGMNAFEGVGRNGLKALLWKAVRLSDSTAKSLIGIGG